MIKSLMLIVLSKKCIQIRNTFWSGKKQPGVNIDHQLFNVILIHTKIVIIHKPDKICN